MKVSYGVSIVSSESDLYSIFSIAVLYAKKQKKTYRQTLDVPEWALKLLITRM